MLFHLEKKDNDDKLYQHEILINFTSFCQTIPKCPSSYIFHLFVLYIEKCYDIELDNLLITLYKRGVLPDIIPVSINKICEIEESKTSQSIFQHLLSIFRLMCDNIEDLKVLCNSILLSVLDMVKKKCDIYMADQTINRLQTLNHLKPFKIGMGNNSHTL